MYKKKGELDKAVTLMRDAESLFPRNKDVAESLRDLLDAQRRGKR